MIGGIYSMLSLKTEGRDRLYYDQWEYAFSFFLKEAHALRERNVEKLERNIAMRQNWPGWQARYTAPVVDNLKAALTHINSISAPFKMIVSGHHITIYTNDSALASDLKTACGFVRISYSRQAVIDRPRDTVLLLEPKHSIRSYFKSQWFPGAKVPALRDFFQAQQGAIEPSPALRDFLKSTNQHDLWFPNHYYVDYDDPRYATMLAMIMPRCFRKTLAVTQRINN